MAISVLYLLVMVGTDSTTNCEEGAVRLVDGSTTESGRLDVCKSGIWGSVCGNGFSTTDAYVVCRELGLGISGTHT